MEGSRSAFVFSTAEAELIAVAQQRDAAGDAALNRLVDDHAPVLVATLRRFRIPSRDYDADAYDEAYHTVVIALLESILRYDPARRAALWTSARPYVRGALRKHVTGEHHAYAVPLEPGLGLEGPTTPQRFALVESSDQRAAVRRFVQNLSSARRDLVIRLYWNGESQVAIATARGVSRSAVSQQVKAVMDQGREELEMWNQVRDAA